MKATTVNFSDIVKHDRMDAGFFIAINENKATIDKLVASYSKEEALQILNETDLPVQKMDFLKPLSRTNSGKHLTVKEYQRIIEELPHEALDLLVANSQALFDKLSAERAKLVEKVDKELDGVARLKNL